MKLSTGKSDSLDYAQWCYHRVNARVIQTFQRAAKYNFLLDRFSYPQGWRDLETAIDQAVGADDLERVINRCDLYERKARSYCWRWLLALARTNRRKKAMAANV